MRLLSAIAIGMLRIGGELWKERPPGSSLELFARQTFADLWKMLAEFGDEPKSRF
jgi:hypothetical protein